MQRKRILPLLAGHDGLIALLLPLPLGFADAIRRLGGLLLTLDVRRNRGAGDLAAERGAQQRVGPQPVRPVIREVALATGVQTGNARRVVLRADAGHGAGLRVGLVADPQPAHRVVRRREDPHRYDAGILAHERAIHLHDPAQPRLKKRARLVRQVQIDQVLAADAQAHVAHGPADGPRGHVTRYVVPIRRVPLFQEVKPLLFGDREGIARVALLPRDPDPSTFAAARLGHQPVLVTPWNAGRVKLNELAVGELRPLLVHARRRRPGRVARHR